MRSLSAILTGAALVIAAPVEALTLQSAALPSAIIGDRSDAIVRVAEGCGPWDIVAAHPSLVGCPAAAMPTPITAARPDTGAAHGVIAVILRFTVGTRTDFGTRALYQCGWSPRLRTHIVY